VPSFLDQVAIVGVAESELGYLPHRTELQLHAQAAMRALADAGIEKAEVDGLLSLCNSRLIRSSSLQMAEYLGIFPTYTDSTSIGGSSFVVHLEHAAMAIATGICQTALITYGSTQASTKTRTVGGANIDPVTAEAQFERPYGFLSPISAYALAAQRHMHLYGTTNEQLAEIAVACRQWAALNPVAAKREPISVADVLSSPMVSSPLHLLDCCLVTDGGGAVVMTSLERARRLPKAPVRILGAAEGHTHLVISQMPELTVTGARETGKRAFAMAGLTPSEIDLVEVYDSFTITYLLQLEDLGFCAKGEGGAFVQGGRTAPGGALPVNTMGGGLSYGHPGMFGIFTVIEAVRQLRGECGDRQVPNARTAVASGMGGVLSSQGTVILGRE
jgi:acetyl-CoA acetyltransferase